MGTQEHVSQSVIPGCQRDLCQTIGCPLTSEPKMSQTHSDSFCNLVSTKDVDLSHLISGAVFLLPLSEIIDARIETSD